MLAFILKGSTPTLGDAPLSCYSHIILHLQRQMQERQAWNILKLQALLSSSLKLIDSFKFPKLGLWKAPYVNWMHSAHCIMILTSARHTKCTLAAIQEATCKDHNGTSMLWNHTLSEILELEWGCCREKQLLEASRHWIRPEDLDARIEDALDNPVQMFAPAQSQI